VQLRRVRTIVSDRRPTPLVGIINEIRSVQWTGAAYTCGKLPTR
jgi:hypothetical protein